MPIKIADIIKYNFNFNNAELQKDETLRNLGEELKKYNIKNNKETLPDNIGDFNTAMAIYNNLKLENLSNQKENEKQAAIRAANASNEAKNRAEEAERFAREAAKRAEAEKLANVQRAEEDKRLLVSRALADSIANKINIETSPLIFSLAEAIVSKRMVRVPKVEPDTVVVPSAPGPKQELPQANSSAGNSSIANKFTLSEDIFGGSPISSESEIVLNKSKQIPTIGSAIFSIYSDIRNLFNPSQSGGGNKEHMSTKRRVSNRNRRIKRYIGGRKDIKFSLERSTYNEELEKEIKRLNQMTDEEIDILSLEYPTVKAVIDGLNAKANKEKEEAAAAAKAELASAKLAADNAKVALQRKEEEEAAAKKQKEDEAAAEKKRVEDEAAKLAAAEKKRLEDEAAALAAAKKKEAEEAAAAKKKEAEEAAAALAAAKKKAAAEEEARKREEKEEARKREAAKKQEEEAIIKKQ